MSLLLAPSVSALSHASFISSKIRFGSTNTPHKNQTQALSKKAPKEPYPFSFFLSPFSSSIAENSSSPNTPFRAQLLPTTFLLHHPLQLPPPLHAKRAPFHLLSSKQAKASSFSLPPSMSSNNISLSLPMRSSKWKKKPQQPGEAGEAPRSPRRLKLAIFGFKKVTARFSLLSPHTNSKFTPLTPFNNPRHPRARTSPIGARMKLHEQAEGKEGTWVRNPFKPRFFLCSILALTYS